MTDLFKDNIGDYATFVLTYIKSVSAIMSYLRIEYKDQFNELKENGFGVSLTGNVFSRIHGDLVTENLMERQRSPLILSAVVLVPISTQ